MQILQSLKAQHQSQLISKTSFHWALPQKILLHFNVHYPKGLLSLFSWFTNCLSIHGDCVEYMDNYGENSDLRIIIHYIKQSNIKEVVFLIQSYFCSPVHKRYERGSMGDSRVEMREILRTPSVKPKTQLILCFLLLLCRSMGRECFIHHPRKTCHMKESLFWFGISFKKGHDSSLEYGTWCLRDQLNFWWCQGSGKIHRTLIGRCGTLLSFCCLTITPKLGPYTTHIY